MIAVARSLLRHVLGSDGNAVRHRTTESQACQQPKSGQRFQRSGGRSQQGEQAERKAATDQHRFAAEAVGQRTADEPANHHADQPDGDDRPERGASDVHLLNERRRDEPHDLGIEPVHEDHGAHRAATNS